VNLDKRTIFEEGLKDPEVEVHVLEAPGLVAPPTLKYPTMFVYGLNMPNPVRDLTCDDLGIKAILSFNQEPHETFVPWSAVLAIVLKYRGVAISWKQDSPENTPYSAPIDIPPSPTTQRKPWLKSV
jgi:hypothetical protein